MVAKQSLRICKPYAPSATLANRISSQPEIGLRSILFPCETNSLRSSSAMANGLSHGPRRFRAQIGKGIAWQNAAKVWARLSNLSLRTGDCPSQRSEDSPAK
jgi:hypothetical protein